jgi:hypothetical protein
LDQSISSIRGVLLAGKFKTQSQLNEMTPDDQRNTLIFILSNSTNQTVASGSYFQSFDNAELAGIGAVLAFIREEKIKNDTIIRAMSIEDMRNTLSTEINVQTKLPVSVLQSLKSMDLVRIGLGVYR